MKSHRRYLRRIRTVVVLALCVPLSASAGALAAPAVDGPLHQSAPKIGDTPADFAQSKGTAKSTYPPNGFTGGDNPADRPSASGAPEPATIQVVRPERTIVRDVNDALPTALASLALLIALGGAGFALIRTRSLQRGVAGRSH